MKRKHLFRYVFFCVSITFIFPVSVYANLTCILVGTAEVLFPGAGYAYLGHWDKALSFGAARWSTALIGDSARSDETYQEDPDMIYRRTTNGDEESLDIYLNRPTYLGNTIAPISGRLALISIYDFYDKTCEDNPGIYQYLYAPFQFNKFATDYRFLVPIGIDVYSSSVGFDSDITYHLEDVSRDELFFWQGVDVYLAGVSEELLFRGVLQNWFFKKFRNSFSYNASRWSAIVGSSVLFGLSHSGTGLQASAASAFFFSLYQGWVYHSYDNKYNLTIPIAIHSWGNMITNFTVREHAKVQSEEVNYDQIRTQPLLVFNYSL